MSGPGDGAVADAERHARVLLTSAVEPGDPALAEQVATFGPVATLERLRRAAPVAGRIEGIDPAAELARAAGLGIRFVVPGDDEWPASLDDLSHTEALHRRGGVPVGLWVRGGRRLDEADGLSLAIVGSRSSTTYGEEAAARLAAEVGKEGVPIVSGAAFGIDQAAHRGAMAVRALTVAVVAGGVDRSYPRAHHQLLTRIGEVGVVVSEAPLGTEPTRFGFLARNRLIAALSRGSVVVEAAARSGALNTASWAEGLSRVVMGVPGPITSAVSEGVHELIRARGALLVTRGADVLEAIGPSGRWSSPARRQPATPRDQLTFEERELLDHVPAAQAQPTEVIASAAGLAADVVAQTLRRLVVAGLVEGLPVGWRLTRLAIESR